VLPRTRGSTHRVLISAYRALATRETEVQAIGAWQSMSTRSIPLPLPGADDSEAHFRVMGHATLFNDPNAETVSLPAYLEKLVEPVGLSDEDLHVLRTGIATLSGSRFHLSGPAPGTAIPVALHSGPPEPLVQALHNEDVATSLDLALSTLPPAHWAIEAMLGATFKPSQNRQPAGPALLHAVAEANTTDNSYTD
jgi:hypothetical protein